MPAYVVKETGLKPFVGNRKKYTKIHRNISILNHINTLREQSVEKLFSQENSCGFCKACIFIIATNIFLYDFNPRQYYWLNMTFFSLFQALKFQSHPPEKFFNRLQLYWIAKILIPFLCDYFYYLGAWIWALHI
jgi:hypothetical protein